jgi:hypothetical protein
MQNGTLLRPGGGRKRLLQILDTLLGFVDHDEKLVAW